MISKQDVSQLWDLANIDPSDTRGKTVTQIRAFRSLLVTQGGVGSIACRPAEKLNELARRKICSPHLSMILRQMARVELRARVARRELANLHLELDALICAAANPEPRI